MLRAEESALQDLATDASFDQVQAAAENLPLAIQSSNIQLVDHCYRRRGYGGGYRDYGYRPRYAPRHYSGYRDHHYDLHHHHYQAPRTSYYRNDYYYPRRSSGFGLYIGF